MPLPPELADYLDATDAANYLGITVRSLNHHRAAGRLIPVMVNRTPLYRRLDLQRFQFCVTSGRPNKYARLPVFA